LVVVGVGGTATIPSEEIEKGPVMAKNRSGCVKMNYGQNKSFKISYWG
jgi:hypothetical protein